MLKFVFAVYLFSSLAGAFIPADEAEPSPTDSVYAIFKDKVPICAGVLVKNSAILFIVTAAHCVYEVQCEKINFTSDTELQQLKISVSIYPCYRTSRLDVLFKKSHFDHKEALCVEQVIVHPYYMPPSRDYDIAILKVSPTKYEDLSYELSVMSTLNLSKTEPSSGNPISLVDWDLKAESNNLKISKGTIEDRKSCRTKLSNYIYVSSKMLCANFQSDIVPDGGPLFFKGDLAGVASYNAKDSKRNLPKIYTNIVNSEIYSFIKKYTS